MTITEKTLIKDLWEASQEQRDRAKEYFGVGTIRLHESYFNSTETIGIEASNFINNTKGKK